MIETDHAVEAQFVAGPAKRAIATQLPNTSWTQRISTGSGVDDQLRLDQPLVVAVARPEHHAVLAERDRLAVAVGRDVTDSRSASAYAEDGRVQTGSEFALARNTRPASRLPCALRLGAATPKNAADRSAGQRDSAAKNR